MERAFPFVYAALLFGIIGWLNLITQDSQHYRLLAESFLACKLYFISMPPAGWGDTALFDGRHFWPHGPFPAVLMMPFLWLGYLPQAQLSFCITLAVFYSCFRLAKKLDFTSEDACWFALAFCFATSFIGVAAAFWGGFSPHVLAVLFLFLAIIEYEGAARPWLIGGLIGLAMTNRAPTGVNILFFVLMISLGAAPIRDKLSGLAKLMVTFAAFAGLIALYNYARFDNFLESGHSLQITGAGISYAKSSVAGNNAGSLFSLSNAPNHLWTFLFGLPEIKAVGTSVFIVSPFLVYLVSVRRWDLTNKLIVINVGTVLLVVLAFRSTGFEQMGYRFSLDFMPFVFWLLMRSRAEMTRGFRSLIFLASVVDLWLVGYFLATAIDRRQG